MKKELRLCSHCNRRNWNDHDRCSWCGRVTYTRSQKQVHRIMDATIFAIVMGSLVTLAWRLI